MAKGKSTPRGKLQWRFGRLQKQFEKAKKLNPDDPEDCVMPLGSHAGKTLGEIADDDEGLLYLDYIVGQWDESPLVQKVCRVLETPERQERLRRLLEDG